MLRLPPFRYVAAPSARDAARVLASEGPKAMAVAGGTDLFPNMKRRQFEPAVVVGLRGLPGASDIAANGTLRLGALATLTQVAENPAVLARWPALAHAAASVSSPPLRNAGTIGGNLCVDTRCTYYNQTEFWRASIGYCMKRPAGGLSPTPPAGFIPARALHDAQAAEDAGMKKDGDVCLVAPGSDKCWALSSSDTAPVMMALGAEVTLVGTEGERSLPVSALYGSDGIDYLAKRPEEILTEIRVPARDDWRATYRKVRRRGSIDFPILGVAAAVRLGTGGVVEDARIVLGAVHVAPVVAVDAQEFLRGRTLDRETIEMAAGLAAVPAKPLDNADLFYAWRKRMVRVEVARALAELA